MKSETICFDKVTLISDGITLLGGITLRIFQGEIMGLISVNAHGLEAFIQLLQQNIPIHYGRVYFGGRLVNSYKRSSMSHNRVALIESGSRLVEDLTVADNIFVLRHGFKKFVIDPDVLKEQLDKFTRELGVHIDASAQVAGLTTYEKYVVELLRAVITGTRLVVLRDIGVDAGLRALIGRCAARGISFLYISGHHKDVFSVCDRAALMMNGEIHSILSREDFNADIIPAPDFRILSAETCIAGKKAFQFREASAVETNDFDRTANADENALEFQNVSAGEITGFSMTVKAGECIALFDPSPTALDNFSALVTGGLKPERGQIFLGGRKVMPGQGFRVIPENPTSTALFPDLSYIENLCFLLERRAPFIWLTKRILNSVLREYEPLIGPDIHERDIEGLSASSLHSLVYYRIHLLHPKAVFCVRPFAGVDMYLRYHLVKLMRVLQARGIAVIILTDSTHTEMADRTILLR